MPPLGPAEALKQLVALAATAPIQALEALVQVFNSSAKAARASHRLARPVAHDARP